MGRAVLFHQSWKKNVYHLDQTWETHIQNYLCKALCQTVAYKWIWSLANNRQTNRIWDAWQWVTDGRDHHDGRKEIQDQLFGQRESKTKRENEKAKTTKTSTVIDNKRGSSETINKNKTLSFTKSRREDKETACYGSEHSRQINWDKDRLGRVYSDRGLSWDKRGRWDHPQKFKTCTSKLQWRRWEHDGD